MDAAGARLTTFLRAGEHPRLSRRLRRLDRAPSDGLRRPGAWRARLGQGPDRRRDGCLLLHRPGPRAAGAPRCLHAELVDAQALVNWVRIVKSPAEVALMRVAAAHRRPGHGGRDRGDPAGRARVRRGRPNLRGADRRHAGALGRLPGGPAFGAERHQDRGGPSDLVGRPLRTRHGRPSWSWPAAVTATTPPLARTVCLGRPPDGLPELAAIVADGLEVALDAAHAGRTCHEVEAAWRALITKQGLREELQDRLLDWARLSAGLGRAHGEPASPTTATVWSPTCAST